MLQKNSDYRRIKMASQGPFEMILQEEEIVQYQRAVSRLICKLDRRLIPFLALLETARFGFQFAIGPILLYLEYIGHRFLNVNRSCSAYNFQQ
jgi:hypothetical protein